MFQDLVFASVVLVAIASPVVTLAAETTTTPFLCPVVGASTNDTIIDTRDPIVRFGEISGMCLSYTYMAPSGQPILYAAADGGGGTCRVHKQVTSLDRCCIVPYGAHSSAFFFLFSLCKRTFLFFFFFLGERIGIWDSATGERLLTVRLPNTTTDVFNNEDWESMAVGPCGSFVGTCIYIADTGDNTARASSGRRSQRINPYRILKIIEPDWQQYQDNEELPLESITVLPFDYLHPDSPKPYADSEGSFIDYTGWGNDDDGESSNNVGDFYIVTKWDSKDTVNLTRIFKIPVNVWPSESGVNITMPYSPEPVGTYPDNGPYGNDVGNMTIRRADMSYDGTLIALGDVIMTRLFLRCPGQSVAEVLASESTTSCHQWDNPVKGQMETFAFAPNGKLTFQIPEGHNRGIGKTELIYDADQTEQICPVVKYDTETGNCHSTQDSTMVLPKSWCDDGAEFYDTGASAPGESTPSSPTTPSKSNTTVSSPTTTTTTTNNNPTTNQQNNQSNGPPPAPSQNGNGLQLNPTLDSSSTTTSKITLWACIFVSLVLFQYNGMV
jgi:hypothetical protein